ncbi:MFS transporter [Paenibacillus mucilaginosus]|uniref:Major facilitator superfamily MFS_1 n=1 Tax=Paenibacillus mucilaginosus (strain KNP414) TaxID=1036673 RepID=F8FL34_PAEMK|nr:MFS transporter [Paenibacillus mucilaginosus]AEI39953.1 major facilitator superfamily MFS_1 [Paenibacillus mucilaginosus KNP414]MCG7216378.1 MFS transporter [Paenibacillus mucilaginosus]WDM29212.1 MFS transporter [Paenibacillus mucilaginosus]
MFKLTTLFFLILFVIGTDTFLISPLIPTLQHLFHIPTEYSGWMVGAYALGYALFALIAGPLSDGWDRKKVMLSGMICFSVSTMLCGLATGFWSMFLFRFLAGVSAAFTAPQVWASIPALFPAPQIVKVSGIVMAGLASSQAFGIPIGSHLASSHWSYPFFTIGACALLLAVFIFYALPELKPNPGPQTKTPIFSRYLPLLNSRMARRAFLAHFLFQCGFFAAFAFIGKWVTDRFHLSIDQTGSVMFFLGLGNIVGSFGGGYVIKALNRYNTLVAGFLVSIACFIVLPHLPSLAAFESVYFFIFVHMGIVFPLILGMLNSLNPAIRGTISSLANSIMYAATTLGSWIAGLIYAAFSGFYAVGIFAAVCFAGSLLSFIFSGILAGDAKPKKEPAA